MISITYVGKRVAITGFLSVYFFRETVVRPTVQLRSDPKVSASLVVSEFCISTITLVLAANYAARKFLSMNSGTFTGDNATGGIPTAPSPRPPAHVALVPNGCESSKVLKTDNPCTIESPISSSPSFQQSSSFQSSSSVSTTRLLILDLPLNSKCNRLSITSNTTLVAHDDDIFSDEASWIKDMKLSDDKRTFHEEYATAHPTHAQDEHNVDTLPPFVPLHTFSPLVSTPLDFPTFASNATLVVHDYDFLSDEAEYTKAIELPGDAAEGTFHEVQAHPTLDKHEHKIDTLPPFFSFPTSSLPVFQPTSLDLPIITSTCNHEPACTTPDKHEHHGDFDILSATTTTIDINYGPSPTNTNPDTDLPLLGPTNPTNALAQKPKVTHLRSDQKFLPDKIRSARQQKRKPRASRLTTARDSIVRSRHRRHANKLVHHLVHICERIRVDHAALIDTWVAGMAEVGLSSLLTGHRATLPASPPSPIVDEVSAPEPGSRMKVRLASLRQRTHAVAAAVPATTATTITSSLSWQRTSSTALRHQKSRPYKLRVFSQQKRKPRACYLNAARDSIARSRLRRHAKRIGKSISRNVHVAC
ncbi:uncharacterized protein EDB91DRAFT_319229 [Suillus paluster]|uniref:uncharacterized protein n=1 Tax=Suillus paluster TaxID=48578 RepID=UPI001B863CF2|nr:uncharacterized protein EDB91DRAFT_319229 [Suillus paluster]KAG1741877.1 hypothetical protein EDB91DRAFT_319229 [Suillus paluster]